MQPIYVDVSDEITTVIERLKKAENGQLFLVVPKGALLLQSMVNLKLIKKTAADQKKELTLVTTDKIGRNLATQVGLPVLSRLDAESEEQASAPSPDEEEDEPRVIDGVKVHRYYEDREEEKAVDDTDEREEEPEPIVPRELFLAKEAEAETENQPIVIRPIAVREPEETPIEPPALPFPAEPAVELIAPKVAGEKESPVQPPAPEPPPLQGEKAAPKQKRIRRRPWLFLLFLLVLLLIGGGAAGMYFLPATVVRIAVKPARWTKDITVSATAPGSSADDAQVSVPAETLVGDASLQTTFKATGSKETGDSASGTAQLSYIYDGTPQTVPAGSKLQVSGLTFTTTQDVTVPGAQVKASVPVAGSATVSIQADQPGTASNLSATPASVLITGTHLYAQIVSTSGGTSKQVPVITQTDIANAREDLNRQLQDATKTKLAAAIKGRSLLYDEKTDSYSFDSFSSSVLAGTQADSGTVSGKATAKRLAVDKDAVNQAVRSYLQKGVEKDQSIIIDSSVPGALSVQADQKKASLTVATSGRTTKALATDSLREQIAGKSQADAAAFIRLVEKDAAITFEQNPSWWPLHNLPPSTKYLQLHVEYE